MTETFPKDDNHCTCRTQTTREAKYLQRLRHGVNSGCSGGLRVFFLLELSPVKITAQTAQLTVASLSLSLCGSFSYLLNCYHITTADVIQIRQRRHDYGTPLRLPAAVDADTHIHKQLTVTDFCHRRINYVTYFDKLRLSLLQFVFWSAQSLSHYYRLTSHKSQWRHNYGTPFSHRQLLEDLSKSGLCWDIFLQID